MKQTKLEKLTGRVAELELIVASNRRPPSRLGNCLRFIVENISTLEAMIEERKAREQQ
jgi:hypothetical protein